jgi:hypothetical protein
METKHLPEWFQDKFYNEIENALSLSNEYVLEWFISKTSLVTMLNHVRGKGYKCQWIEKSEGQYIIKISK